MKSDLSQSKVILGLLIVSRSVVSNSFVAPWIVACQGPLSMEFPRQKR